MDLDETMVRQMDTREAFEAMKVLLLEDPPNKMNIIKEMPRIKEGMDFKFNIYFLFAEKYTEKKSYIIIPDNMKGERIKYEDFFEEIDNRTTLMKRLLIDSIEDDDIYSPR